MFGSSCFLQHEPTSTHNKIKVKLGEYPLSLVNDTLKGLVWYLCKPYFCITMKLNTLNIALAVGGAYILYKLLTPTKPASTPIVGGTPTSDEDYSNFLGIFKKKKKTSSTSRAVATRCETNLERLGRLFPNNEQYNAEIGKAYQQQGANFNAWAQATAKPCFVVGAEQGGLQGGGISFSGEFC